MKNTRPDVFVRRLRTAALALLFLSLGWACIPAARSTASLSASFREKHDYESLSRLVGHLRLGMSTEEVDGLLGSATYSPIAGQFYYLTADRKTPEGTPIGLVVDFRRTNVRTGEEISGGRIESFWLGPIGE